MNQKRFYIEDWQVSPAEGTLLRDNDEIHLEPKVMEVLVYFASRPGEVISREELEQDVWHGALVGYDSVTSTVIKLRKALNDNAKQPRYVATIPKRGYQLIAPVKYPDKTESTATTSQKTGKSFTTPSQQSERQPEQKSETHSTRTSSQTKFIHAGLAALIALSILWLVWPSSITHPPTREKEIELPSVVVLPFENMDPNAKHDNFIDGITEDIITDLSRLSSLLVLASNTSFLYKGRRITPQEVRQELKVDFVLKGNVRRSGDTIRINAQLVNTKTGFNTWAARYDRKVAKVFIIQDEVISNIVKSLAIEMTSKEKQRLTHRTTDNLKAYDLFQEGQRISKVSTKETGQQAQTLYRKVIELDPGYGRAYGALAYSMAFDYRRGWTDTPIETVDRALALARKAVEHDNNIPQTYWALGYVYMMRKELEQARKAAAQSINIAPNYADGYGLLALISNFLGQPKKAIGLITKGMLLNPYYTWDYPYNLGVAHYMLGNTDKAIAALEKAQARNENVLPIKLYLAASYIKAGRQDDAEWTTEQIQMLSPAATLTHTEQTVPIVNPEFKRMLIDDLRSAGLPE